MPQLASASRPPWNRQSVIDGTLAGKGIQHGAFVVADQVDHRHPRQRRRAAKPGNDPGTVRPAVDVIAEMQQQRRGDGPGGQVGGDQAVQAGQLVVAAMDIADGIDAVAGRQDRRGGVEFQHDAPIIPRAAAPSPGFAHPSAHRSAARPGSPRH